MADALNAGPGDGHLYRMPTVFGPALGPRQAPAGMRHDPAASPRKSCAYAVWRTDAGLLGRLLPPGFALRGEAVVVFEFSYMTDIAWLAGRGYNMLTVRIPATYGNGDDAVDGYFQPVVWENMTEPILSGREELGWAKIYADLPAATHEQDEIVCRAEWMGFRFLELRLGARAAGGGALQSGPVLHRKYIPATQHWGQADVDYVTLTPAGGSQARLLDSATAQRCALRIARPRWEDMPTQHAIVGALAGLPLLECVRGGTYQTVGGKDLSDQVRLG